MALKIIKTSDLEEISTCNDESFLTITQKISEDNFISNKMQIKNLPLNNYYKKTAIDELLKTYSKTTHNHDFNSLSNLPTTLSGYGITDIYTKTEIQDNTLNKIKATSGKMLVDTGFSLGVKDGDDLISYNYGMTGAPTVKFGLSYDSDMYSYIDSYLGKLDLIASNQIYIRTPYLNLKVPNFRLSGSNGSFSVDVSDNKENNKLYASIPAEFTDIVKAPKINIYSSNNTVLEGALWNSTYNINGVIKDGLHLSHENGKYLALTYKNASTGIYDPYMIFDVEGVLKNDSNGDNWGPIRFEQNVFFKHGLKIGGGEDIILAGKGVNTRITALENVVTQGTGMVEWNNILNKPNTFTPSSHKHAISDITSLQTTLDSKASSTHNHDSVYVKQDGSTPITSRQQLKMGSYVFEAHAGNGTEGYALVAEFKISKNYQNTPIKIELARRGVLYSNITIQFRNTDSPDPTLQNFVYEGSDCMAYMAKADTSTWNLYIRKTEAYDVIFITKYSNPNSAITTIWKESVFTSLPEGGTYATPLQHSISEITNLQTTLDKKAPINYVSQFEGGAISSNFRKTIIGTTDMCGFVKSFRKNDNTDTCMPQYGSGIAWGQADTHGMLCVDYINPIAYVAGGNGNKLNWYKQIAWKDDLNSYSLKTHNHDYLPLSGGNLTGELKLENGKRILGKNTDDKYINLICIDKSNHVNVSHPAADQLVLNARFGNIVACDGSKTYTVYHRGNFNPSDYLPKSGGTMTGNINFMDAVLIGRTITGEAANEINHRIVIGCAGEDKMLFDEYGGDFYFRRTKDGTINQIARITSDGIYEGATLLKDKYATKTHTHDYLPLSGGTITGALAIEQDKGIVSANVEGGTLLVETSTNVNVGKTTKAINLICSVGCVNGDMILTHTNYMFYMKNMFYVLFERNNGTINKNINTCFDSYDGRFTAPEAGQYLVMCSGYKLSTSDSMYIACLVGSERSNRNELYRTGSSGFTLITLSEEESLQVYKCPTGNVITECISSLSYVNMLIAKIN